MEIRKYVKLSREREVGIDSQTAREICNSTYLCIYIPISNRLLCRYLKSRKDKK